MPQKGFKRKLAAILSADVTGYSRLMQEDETATIVSLTSYRQLMTKLINQHHGRVVDAVGDNLLAEFASVVDAVQGAIAIQKEIKLQNSKVPVKRRMLFRIGVNLGDLVVEGDRLYGDGINIAARLEALADPGGICISKTTYDQIEDKLSLEYEYLGEKDVKNIAKPVRAYKVCFEDGGQAFGDGKRKNLDESKPEKSAGLPGDQTIEDHAKNLFRDSQPPLLTTKIYIPKPRHSLVQRTSLLERLNKGLDKKLTLISAPAGFGKTTLLTQWIFQNKMPAAWISLEKGDSDPVQFMRYVIAALQSIESNIGKAALASFQSPQQVPIGSVIISLIDEIVDIPNEFILVLDDFHTIENADIHKNIGMLVDHLPPQMHLVIATRIDPNLPLSRLRVRNQINELRASDLSFTRNETTRFFNEMMKIGLPSHEISILESRTEGWIAGLQLAALSMQNREDVSEFITSFTGDDRHIVDYLAEEVLNHQSEEIQHFLLQTSILNRLSGILCDFVTDRKDSQKILIELEKANLFIVPLDNKRHWYRYHHLFADLLNARLLQSQPDIVDTLHQRASEWFEQNDLTTEAVNHALSAKDYERAARVVEENTLMLLAQGELQTLLRWIKLLPKHVASHRPWLCVYQAWVFAFAGRLGDVRPLLEEVEMLLPSSDSFGERNGEATDQQEMVGNIAAMRAYLSVLTGDFSLAIKFANLASETLSERSRWTRSVSQWALGIAHRMHGDLTAASQACSEVVKLGREMDNTWTTVTGLTDLALVCQIRGRLRQSTALYREALQLASERGARNLGYMGRVEAGLAYVVYEYNDLAAAQAYLATSIEKTKKWDNPNHFVFSYNLLARILQAKGDFIGAMDALSKADHMKDKFPIMLVLHGMLENSKVRCWLAQDNMVSIERWVKESGISDACKGNTLSEIPDEKKPLLITYARILIAQNNFEAALNLLERLKKNARAGGRMYTLIEILNLQALALLLQQKIPLALENLKKSLSIAEPEGFIRSFIDEGALMFKLLENSIDSKIEIPRSYVKKLKSAFRLSKLIETNAGPVERLSERELEVLRLVASGLSNKKIVEGLYISMSTVKTHIRNIYSKLSVHSRTEAIHKANELNIL